MHCDYMMHITAPLDSCLMLDYVCVINFLIIIIIIINVDLSSWLDSPMFWAP